MIEDKRFDKTQLSAHQYGKFVYRDYAAHFFRWGFASRFIGPTKSVLDIGCGRDIPLAHVLVPRISTKPKSYIGVDLNKNLATFNFAWALILEEFNFVDSWPTLYHIKEGWCPPYDVIVCYEVIEHMMLVDAEKLVRGAYHLLVPGGVFLLSTPVYDGVHMPKNHIHEFTIEELSDLLKAVGWMVERRFGTFASWPTMKKAITPPQRKLCEQLAEFYSWDVISCFLAPLYPDHARNNVWILRK